MKPKRKVISEISDQINKSLYNYIRHHPQVVKSQIVDDFLKLNIDGHTEPQLFPKLLLQVSVLELHNKFVSDTEDSGINKVIYEENNRIICDST